MELNPVAIVWSNKKIDNTLKFKEGKLACVMCMFASTAKFKTVVFDRETY